MPDAESVADTVRRAAALLRKRAAAATPGPWVTRWDGQQCQLQAPGSPEGNPIAEWTYGIATWEPDATVQRAECDTGDAEFIATMHPTVALLIADSWQKTAAVMDETASVRVAVLTGDLGEDRPTVISGAGWRHHDWTATLAAARAVLGQAS